jgi:DnaJ homolog subfamily B member 12
MHSGNIEKAIKFAEKSVSLFSTDEAVALLAKLRKKAESSESSSSSIPSSSKTSATATGAETHPSASGTTHRHTANPASSSEKPKEGGTPQKKYTPDQLKIVKRIRACNVMAYYEILDLKKGCDENDVKKAYRKVSS